MNTSLKGLQFLDASKLVRGEGRCNSTLSPKEAEYQAWKKRQNYKPFVSQNPKSKNRGSATQEVTTAPLTLQSSTLALNIKRQGPKKSHSPICVSNTNLQRSASFHYPDGMHKVQVMLYLIFEVSMEIYCCIFLESEYIEDKILSYLI